jgi:uncharacterized repeat protein (TIGR03803 family)
MRISHLITISFLFISLGLSAQQTPIFQSVFLSGGEYYEDQGFGAISFLQGDGESASHFFLPNNNPGLDAHYPELVQAANGKVYGLQHQGGKDGVGAIFELDPSSLSYSIKHEFLDNAVDGIFPMGGMIALPDGSLLGSCSADGAANEGVLFRFDPQSGLVTTVANFMNCTAKNPHGQLLLASDGWVYGTTKEGGLNNLGTIYRFNPETEQLQVIWHFQPGLAGSEPTGGLCETLPGVLHGFVAEGGDYNDGALYQLVLSGFQFSIRHSFNQDSDLGLPTESNGPVSNGDGSLCAVLGNGGPSSEGAICKWSFSNPTMQFPFSFNASSGFQPFGRLAIHPNGNWYGSNLLNNYEHLFEFNPQTGSFTSLVDSIETGFLSGTPLVLENGELILHAGTSNSFCGGEIVRYEIANQASQSILLNTKLLGGRPYGALCKASDGNYYGLCSVGGFPENALGFGTIFRFDPENAETTLLSTFEGSVVRGATGIFTEGTPGKLFAAVVGSQGGRPRIISFDIASGSYSVVVNFTNLDGSIPSNYLLKASNGKLYGTTTFGGGSGSIGTLFEFDPVSLAFSVRYRFTDSNLGAQPYGSLIELPDGKLLGTTLGGGTSQLGTIYTFDPSTGLAALKQTFTGSNGAMPYSGMVEDSEGVYLGTTTQGGAANEGSIYRYTYATNTLEVLASFPDFIVSRPYDRMLKASDGMYYGIVNHTQQSDAQGGMYRFDPNLETITIVRQFSRNEAFSVIHNHQLQELDAILTASEIPQFLCPGSEVIVPFASAGTFSVNNIFTAQLSDQDGNFDSPIAIGSLQSTVADSILAVIPADIAFGNNYRIRVVSSDAGWMPIPGGQVITIETAQWVTVSLDLWNEAPLCAGSTLEFGATSIQAGAIIWKINNAVISNTGNYFQSNSLSDGDAIVVELDPGAGCFDENSLVSNAVSIDFETQVQPRIELLVGSNLSACEGSSFVFPLSLYGVGDSPTITWYVDGVNVGSFTDPLILPATSEQDGVEVWAALDADLTCVVNDPAFSDTVTLSIHQPVFTEQFVLLSAGDSVFLGGTWQTEPGTYADIFVDASGCDSAVTTTVDFSVGLNPPTKVLAEIYPNPGSDVFTISLNHKAVFTWDLFDCIGRKVKSGIGQQQMQWDASGLSPGMYFLKVRVDEGTQVLQWVKVGF